MKAKCQKCEKEREFEDSPVGEKNAKRWLALHHHAAHTWAGKRRLKAARAARHNKSKHKEKNNGLVPVGNINLEQTSVRILNYCPGCKLSLVVLQHAGPMNYCISCGWDLQPFFAAEQYMNGKLSRRRKVELSIN
jgi:hypothetical protein